jgi:hypothetical protein
MRLHAWGEGQGEGQNTALAEVTDEPLRTDLTYLDNPSPLLTIPSPRRPQGEGTRLRTHVGERVLIWQLPHQARERPLEDTHETP